MPLGFSVIRGWTRAGGGDKQGNRVFQATGFSRQRGFPGNGIFHRRFGHLHVSEHEPVGLSPVIAS
jgi:hypothetical protein